MLLSARKNDLVVQETGDELLVYDLKTDKAICLNKTSALVWQNCDGTKSVKDIAAILEKTLGNSINDELVWFAIDQLNKENLLEDNTDFSNKFAGLSRREVIKRVGITSAIALPLVSSLVAPMAVHAQSFCVDDGMGMFPNGCPCMNPSDCTGGSCMSGICG
jgi:hypothetical protein